MLAFPHRKRPPVEPTQPHDSDAPPKRESIALGFIYWIAFMLVGGATPVFLDIFRGLDIWPRWEFSLLNYVRLGLMLPLSLMILTLLIWKDRALAARTARRLNIAAFGMLVLIIGLWFHALFWTTSKVHLTAIAPEPAPAATVRSNNH